VNRQCSAVAISVLTEGYKANSWAEREMNEFD